MSCEEQSPLGDRVPVAPLSWGRHRDITFPEEVTALSLFPPGNGQRGCQDALQQGAWETGVLGMVMLLKWCDLCVKSSWGAQVMENSWCSPVFFHCHLTYKNALNLQLYTLV